MIFLLSVILYILVHILGAPQRAGARACGAVPPSGKRAKPASRRAGGAHVYWWTTPRMRDARFLTDDLNAIWIEAADGWGAGVTVIESMAILGDADGSYREVLRDETGVEVPLRKDHGVHFHEVGADLLARQLEDRLVRDGWVVTRS